MPQAPREVRQRGRWGSRCLTLALVLSEAPAFALAQTPGQPGRRIEGTVFDSTRGEPVTGATVFLFGTPLRATTGPDGSFVLDSVPPGRYTAVFFHERLGELGLSPGPSEVEVVEGGPTRLSLAIPSVATVLAVQCGFEPSAPRESSGVLLGLVTDGETGVPLPRARVRLSWMSSPGGADSSRTVLTDETGWYRACAAPLDVPVVILASFLNHSAPQEEVVVRPGQAGRLDLVVGALTSASLEGRIVDIPSGVPLPGAEVELRGTPLRATSDLDGLFRFPEVQPGHHTILVRYIGREPRADSVRLEGGRHVKVVVQLPAEAIPLPPLEVTVEATPLGERAMGGLQIGAAQIEKVKNRATDVADVLREQHVSGLIVRKEGPQACVGFIPGQVRMNERTGCAPVIVFINGSRSSDPYAAFTIPLEMIDRMVLYRPVEAGVLFGLGSANGVLQIFTRSTR